LAVTVAESCFASGAGVAQTAPMLGVEVRLEGDEPAESAVFGERGARAIVSLAPTFLAPVLETARQYGVATRQIGQVVRGDAFRIEYKGHAVIDTSIAKLYDTWAYSIERILKGR
jgi:phosphoribosylformylglycinamidine (FGAM) synthase-like enzyme